MLSIDTTAWVNELAKKVHTGFSKANQAQISQDFIVKILKELDLSISIPQNSTPQLQIRRLIFTGEKTLSGQDQPQIFRYDQKFRPGVNFILIPDNNVGKSSIMKTIKFALTGDNSDYDVDVKAWMQRVWLQFSVGIDNFTIYIVRNKNVLRGILVLEDEERCLEDVPEIPKKFFDVDGSEKLQERLQLFFFERFELSVLRWTQKDQSVPNGIATRGISWKAFFQAILIPDSSDQYLLCDPQHSIGNQEGLIFSIFLGLRLVESLNHLLVESNLIKRRDKTDTEVVTKKREIVDQLNTELERLRREIISIRTIQNTRQKAFKVEDSTKRIFEEIDPKLREIANNVNGIQEQIDSLAKDIRKSYSRARGLRESIQFKLHFTGLEVLLCPNCEATVDEQSIAQEKEHRTCRLCSTPAKDASPDELDILELEATEFERRAKDTERNKRGLENQLRQLLQRREALLEERKLQEERSKHGYEIAIETPEESAQLENLYVQSGHLSGQIALLTQQISDIQPDGDKTELRLQVMNKTREMLQKEAEQLNETVLQSLSTKTQSLAHIIGVESITDISCSPLGRVKLRKHSNPVSFSGIQNSGEKFRVKLAFFLATMQLGREPGNGKHPGFLMIDQLGSHEMVSEDCSALAKVLQTLDKELQKDIQLICFTTRSEFEQATDKSKIHGPQAGRFAF
jgi:hypothetical protein